jgi:hypothetical protein
MKRNMSGQGPAFTANRDRARIEAGCWAEPGESAPERLARPRALNVREPVAAGSPAVGRRAPEHGAGEPPVAVPGRSAGAQHSEKPEWLGNSSEAPLIESPVMKPEHDSGSVGRRALALEPSNCVEPAAGIEPARPSVRLVPRRGSLLDGFWGRRLASLRCGRRAELLHSWLGAVPSLLPAGAVNCALPCGSRFSTPPGCRPRLRLELVSAGPWLVSGRCSAWRSCW